MITTILIQRGTLNNHYLLPKAPNVRPSLGCPRRAGVGCHCVTNFDTLRVRRKRYERVVFLDADTLVIDNVDELFDIEESAALLSISAKDDQLNILQNSCPDGYYKCSSLSRLRASDTR